MSFTRASYSKDWTVPTDFPTVETSENKVRADIQLLYNDIRDDVNLLETELESTATTTTTPPVSDSGASKIGVSGSLGGANVQAVLDSLFSGQSQHTTDINGCVTNVTYNSTSGDFTITWKNGTTSVIQTELEKVVTNFRYDQETKSLILTYPDGTTTSIPLTSLIAEYDFEDTDDIDFSVVNHKVKAYITAAYKTTLQGLVTAASGYATQAEGFKDAASGYADNASGFATAASGSATTASGHATNAAGSATEASGYATAASGSATAAGVSAGNASTQATNSANSATLSQSWAVGGTGTRSGEDTNNAKYWAEQASQSASGDMKKSVYDSTSAVQNAGGIAAYVDANGGKIDHIKVNNVEQTIVNKTVDLTVPTALADLTADATHRVVTDTEKTTWGAKANAPTYVTSTLDADNWSNSTYSFEGVYPFANYDIEVSLAPTATESERDAYAEGMMTGSPNSNVITALGTVPTDDIPVYIKVVAK